MKWIWTKPTFGVAVSPPEPTIAFASTSTTPVAVSWTLDDTFDGAVDDVFTYIGTGGFSRSIGSTPPGSFVIRGVGTVDSGKVVLYWTQTDITGTLFNTPSSASDIGLAFNLSTAGTPLIGATVISPYVVRSQTASIRVEIGNFVHDNNAEVSMQFTRGNSFISARYTVTAGVWNLNLFDGTTPSGTNFAVPAILAGDVLRLVRQDNDVVEFHRNGIVIASITTGLPNLSIEDMYFGIVKDNLTQGGTNLVPTMSPISFGDISIERLTFLLEGFDPAP